MNDSGGLVRETPLGRSRRLVSAALAGVAELDAVLAGCEAADSGEGVLADALSAALARGAVEGDNLLVAAGREAGPRLLDALARGGDHRLHAGVLALDPAVVALSTSDRCGPLDLLCLARGEEIEGAAAALRERLAAAASALSVAAARLDLQARFVEDGLDEADQPTRDDAAPVPLDADAARQAALSIKAMLAATPHAIASGNRRMLDMLFAGMTSGGAAG